MTRASLLAQQHTKAFDQETWLRRQSHPVIHRRVDTGVNSHWQQQPLNAPPARFLTSSRSFVQPVCSFLLQPTGKGPRLPEVYCVISRLGCFDLFSTVSSACPTKSHPVDRRDQRSCVLLLRLICFTTLSAPSAECLFIAIQLFFFFFSNSMISQGNCSLQVLTQWSWMPSCAATLYLPCLIPFLIQPEQVQTA